MKGGRFRLTNVRTTADVVRLMLFNSIVSILISVGLTVSATLVTGQFSVVGVVIAVLAPLFIAPVMTYLLAKFALELSQARAELEQLVRVDPLTAVLNRRGLEEGARAAFTRAGAHRGLGVIVLDIDSFKTINDSYGHVTGDRAIVEIGAVLRARFAQASAIVGRLGGDEFCVFLEGADLARTLQAAESLRANIEDLALLAGDQRLQLTVSIGIAARDGHDSDWEALYRRADSALYRAKSQGRNCVSVQSQPLAA